MPVKIKENLSFLYDGLLALGVVHKFSNEKRDDGWGGVKNNPNLRDVIYGWLLYNCFRILRNSYLIPSVVHPPLLLFFATEVEI